MTKFALYAPFLQLNLILNYCFIEDPRKEIIDPFEKVFDESKRSSRFRRNLIRKFQKENSKWEKELPQSYFCLLLL